MLPGLLALIALTATLALAGCTEQVEETIADDVNNRSFTFASGVVFHPALANVETMLRFAENGNVFVLTVGERMARGRVRYRPCSLTVDPEPDGSTFESFASGPQGDDVLLLPTCDFDLDHRTLILGNGTIVVISAPAVDVSSNAS
ncbi:MAG: hypothetical protein AB7N91_22315 [Candidatus Tectimicrobiota bacterium]